MLRTVVRMTPSFIPLFRSRNENDYDYLNTKSSGEPETGLDRVKRMYTKNEFDEVSIELNTVLQSTLCGAFFGACFGGFAKSRIAYINFIENNQATIFKSTMQAKKRLQDYVTIAFAKGAYQWGWKLGIFTGLFSCISTTISVYRGDTTLIEYIAAGAFTGALYKVHLGLAATFVGAGLGAVLSTIGGFAVLGLLKATGASMEDIRRALHRIKEARQQQLNEALEKSSEIKNDSLTLHHDTVVQEKGQKKLEDL